MTFARKTVAIVLASTLATGPAYPMTMNELFDSVNAYGNTSGPAVIHGQTLNVYSGGSLFMRAPRKTYSLVAMSPPHWKAGCGGIDAYLGSFSYINKDQFVAMLRNIGSAALGYGFKIAIQNLCPTCDNVMQALEATARMVNQGQVNACEAAKGIVNAVTPDTWEKEQTNTAKMFGVDSNAFSDVADAWMNVAGSKGKSGKVVQDAVAADPSKKAVISDGNLAWKALKRVNGIDDDYRRVIMSLVGTVLVPTVTDDGQANQNISILPATDLSVEALVGSWDHGKIKIPVYKCDDDYSEDGCMKMSVELLDVDSFRTMVRTKLNLITDAIANRTPYADPAAVKQFVAVTDVPVYKMVAVTTSAGNTALADTLVSRYIDLIAAKYAQAYIEEGLQTLRQALARFGSLTSALNAQQLRESIYPSMDRVHADAQKAVAQAMTSVSTTYNIAMELQHIEKALQSEMSEPLRSSYAFGKSIR